MLTEDTPAHGTMLPPPHAAIIVAHSTSSKGVVVNEGGLDVPEYEISKRASIAAMRALSNDFRVTYFHVGPVPGASRYMPPKIEAADAGSPDIAVEIHCNAGPASADYREVIHHAKSAKGKAAAEAVAQALTEAFPWLKPCRARANTVEMDKHLFYFLEKTGAPAIIVEGVFLTNPTHRQTVLAEGGAESYGVAVAKGLRKYLEASKK